MANRTKGFALDVMHDAVCIHSQLRLSHFSDLKTTFNIVQIGKELFQNLKCDELSLLLTILRMGNFWLLDQTDAQYKYKGNDIQPSS